MFSEELIGQFETAAASRLEKLPERKRQYEAWSRQASKGERQAMTMILASSPLSDVQDYEPAMFGAYASHGAMLWERGPFAGQISEELFAAYVVHPRVNTEDLADCRAFFWEQLRERVAGKSLEEAALAVNVWCAEQGTYRSSDARTENPLTFYRSGYGRCGEESVFAVSALRSVGIPARQVYVPLWSHCDDNHAWVEVWCGDGWKFLGACEPEPILNRGWFTNASSRAMMVHARWYLPTEPTEEVSGTEGMVRLLNETSRYANTVRVQVTVQDGNGEPVKGADVHWKVYNESAFGDIANGVTDANGQASLETGKGSILVTAETGILYGEALVNAASETCITVTVTSHAEGRESTVWDAFHFEAPQDSAKNRTVLTAAEQEQKKQIAEQTAHKRAENHAAQRTSVWTEKQQQVLAVLSEKDAQDVTEEVLEDAWNIVQGVQPERIVPAGDPTEWECLWRQFVFCPRVAEERLVPHRKEILRRYEKARKEAGKKLSAASFVRDVMAKLRSCPSEEYPVLRNSAVGILSGGWYSGDSDKILQVQIFRTLGIPARWDQTENVVELWDGEDWNVFEMAEEKEPRPQKAMLHVHAPSAWKYRVDWTVARWKGNAWRTVIVESDAEERTMLLVPGDYRIETANRLPGGTVLGSRVEISLSEDEVRQVWLEKQQASSEELLTDYDMPDVVMQPLETTEQTTLYTLVQNRPGLFLWLEPGAEPTEHLLSELMEYRDIFAAENIGVYGLLAEHADSMQPTLRRAQELVPELQLYTADFDLEMEAAARRMYLEPGKLPLVLVADTKRRGRFGEAGYFVGLGKLLQELIPLV